MPTPDADLARELLLDLWQQVLADTAPNVLDPELKQLINSGFVSIRFCLPTQLLGKLVNPALDCLCLQKGGSSKQSAWDPRSFCCKVIVPWVLENNAVLGDSTDPYVGKPLRRPRLDPAPANVKGAGEWELLFRVLEEVQKVDTASFTEKRLLQVLFAVKEKLREQTFDYIVPERASLAQCLQLVDTFLSESSGGDRGMALAGALFETVGIHFGLYESIERARVNASDLASGAVADIQCFDSSGSLRLAVEVKERDLTLTDVQASLKKSRRAGLKDLLFNAPGIREADAQDVQQTFEKSWASGTNLYRLSIFELVNVCLAIAGEEGRKEFLTKVGEHLDKYNTQPANRRKWKKLLESL